MTARNMKAIKHSINNYINQADVKCISHIFGLTKTTKIYVHFRGRAGVLMTVKNF